MPVHFSDQVGIVVPVFNAFEYLPMCVDSLLEQSYKNIEIILVDDGSFDGSETLCDKYAVADSRVKVFHKENGGQSSARNLGLRNVTSQWVTFVDADDYVEGNYVEELLSLVGSYGADISIGSFTFVTPRKSTNRSTGELEIMTGERAIKRMLLDDGFDMGPWAKLYRTKYFKKYSFPEGKFFEDSLLTYQILSEATRVVFRSTSIYRYMCRPASTVRGDFNEHKLDLIEMTKKAEAFISAKYPNLAAVAHRRVIWAYFSTLNQVLKSGTRDQIQYYAPDMAEYLLSQKNFILGNSFTPKRDQIAYLMLRYFGIKGYWRAWNLYERITK
jgi:glycosyltransferase involved in cell wall biosynthesis